MSERAITQEQVAVAERREGINHPAIDLLDRFSERLVMLRGEAEATRDVQEQQRYIARTHGFLADELEELGDFSVSLVDLIAVWSKARELLNYYQTHALARILTTSYAIAGVANGQYKGVIRFILENDELPEALSNDRGALEIMRSRLDEIFGNVNGINLYVYGTEEHALILMRGYARRAKDGNTEAGRRLKELRVREQKLMTPLLSDLNENMRYGVNSVESCVDRQLEKLAEIEV